MIDKPFVQNDPPSLSYIFQKKKSHLNRLAVKWQPKGFLFIHHNHRSSSRKLVCSILVAVYYVWFRLKDVYFLFQVNVHNGVLVEWKRGTMTYYKCNHCLLLCYEQKSSPSRSWQLCCCRIGDFVYYYFCGLTVLVLH